MAYLAATVLDSYRAEYAGFDNYDHRQSRYGCLSAFQKDTPNLLNAAVIEQAKMAEDHATTIPVIKRKTFTTGSARTCSVQSNYNTSAFVTLSWTTLTAGFHMIPSQYGDNYISYENDFKRKMQDMQIAMGIELDTAAYTYLNTYKAAKNNSTFADTYWTPSSNKMVVPVSDKDTFFNQLDGVMNENDLYGPYNVVASTPVSSMVRNLQAQGAGNAENFSYQFMGYDFHFSNRCTVDSGDFASIFCMPIGSLGFLNWIDPSSRANESNGYQEWSTVPLPDLGMNAGLLYQASCADNSTEAGNGFEASLKESFLFSMDYAFIYAYNSDTTNLPGTIYKAGILAS